METTDEKSKVASDPSGTVHVDVKVSENRIKTFALRVVTATALAMLLVFAYALLLPWWASLLCALVLAYVVHRAFDWYTERWRSRLLEGSVLVLGSWVVDASLKCRVNLQPEDSRCEPVESEVERRVCEEDMDDALPCGQPMPCSVHGSDDD